MHTRKELTDLSDLITLGHNPKVSYDARIKRMGISTCLHILTKGLCHNDCQQVLMDVRALVHTKAMDNAVEKNSANQNPRLAHLSDRGDC